MCIAFHFCDCHFGPFISQTIHFTSNKPLLPGYLLIIFLIYQFFCMIHYKSVLPGTPSSSLSPIFQINQNQHLHILLDGCLVVIYYHFLLQVSTTWYSKQVIITNLSSRPTGQIPWWLFTTISFLVFKTHKTKPPHIMVTLQSNIITPS